MTQKRPQNLYVFSKYAGISSQFVSLDRLTKFFIMSFY